jgi:mono/diheme cytochrome c family protein
MNGIGWKLSSKSMSFALIALLAGCGTEPAGESSDDSGLLADTSGSGSVDTSGSGSVDTGLNDTSTVADTAEDTIADTAVEDVAPDVESDTVADTGAEDTTTTLGELPCEVATILEANCQGCHGAVPVYGAAFSMLTMADLLSPSFTDASRSVAELMVERIVDVRAPMPPAPQPLLTASEVATLTAWVNGGSPAGEACLPPDTDTGVDADTTADTTVDPDAGADTTVDPDTTPEPDTTVEPDTTPEPVCEWEVDFLANAGLGEGDATPFTVPRSANHYECFYFRPTWTGTAQGLKFSALIDDERVVHHWLLYAEVGSGTPGTRRDCSGSHADATLIAGWAPGGDDWVMPPSVGMELPTDTTYFVEIHYANPRNLDITDRSGVRVCGTNTLRENAAATHWLGSELIGFLGAGNHSVTGTCRPTLTEPAHIIKSWPHMHRYGTSMFSEIVRAGGTRETLIDVPFSFDNQISHDTPFVINPGDSIRTTCRYTTDTFLTTFGSNTENEMCYNFVVAWPAGAFNTGGGIRGGSENFCLQ